MQHLNNRQNLIVPNVYWGILGLNYECDLVRLTKNNYATEIEIKVSKADLKKDRDKWHNHGSSLFKYLYFAVPSELADFALTEIPERAGLFSVEERKANYYEKPPVYTVTEVRKPKQSTRFRKWTSDERNKLASLGAMRILGLKKKLLKTMN